MEAWEENFAEQAKGMLGAGITELEAAGILSSQPHRRCPEGCEGTVHGMEIDIGDILMRGNADYCPSCDKVYLLERIEPMYLLQNYPSILRTKILEGATDPDLTDEGDCPLCHASTKKLTKHLTSKLSPGTNTWRICTNCSWNEHKVL